MKVPTQRTQSHEAQMLSLSMPCALRRGDCLQCLKRHNAASGVGKISLNQRKGGTVTSVRVTMRLGSQIFPFHSAVLYGIKPCTFADTKPSCVPHLVNRCDFNRPLARSTAGVAWNLELACRWCFKRNAQPFCRVCFEYINPYHNGPTVVCVLLGQGILRYFIL